MNDRERGVSYYDLFIESRIRGETELHPRPVPLKTALDLAFEAWQQGPLTVGRGTVRVTLSDWIRHAASRDEYLLFNRSDASLPDIPLRHLETGETRMAGKQIREGIDLSCHVLIRRHRDPNLPALMLMTSGSSLPVDKVCKILGVLFRSRNSETTAEHFRREHPSGEAGRTIALHSQFACGGHQNATLANLLNGGELQGVELIEDSVQQLDAASTLDVTSVQYTLQQTRPGRVGVATIERMIRALRGRGSDPSRARVRYKPAGRTKIETHTFDIGALDSAFVRKEIIQFTDPIAARYDSVERRVVERLVALADREGLG